MNPGTHRPPTVQRRAPCASQAAILSTPREWPSSEAELRQQRKERPSSSPVVSESPAGPPADLLPQLPRPRTSDFFRGPQTPAGKPPLLESAHAMSVSAGQKRPRPLHLGHDALAAPWPNSWSHYHFCSEETARSPPPFEVTSRVLLCLPVPPRRSGHTSPGRVACDPCSCCSDGKLL